jgi:hypothetical protein
MPIPRNNPVWNFGNNFTWLRNRHTWTFGGMFRRTTMYNRSAARRSTTLGIANGDPAQNVHGREHSGIRSTDITTALNLYALLVGRVSTGGTYLSTKRSDTVWARRSGGRRTSEALPRTSGA